ncbi:hypothetical protein K437DRAFT_118892 [Tilletiaria anomala UBC 951]|uniref:Uncharacterized protein n=1 Tax=Tilletiaria anomala (strain ATCC 24038 / CBS 436.72 / UBC 951) TaxID=1037660 RepID=A0A066W3S7_TILAU|nr:uncharacterized protein K437DRAFT_118892 [Tilletiaria anomala UBC 951]KDN45744.1 hypothetical protein K437DRAFT_118892 [Tilletiaria anomala UBC 951]
MYMHILADGRGSPQPACFRNPSCAHKSMYGTIGNTSSSVPNARGPIKRVSEFRWFLLSIHITSLFRVNVVFFSIQVKLVYIYIYIFASQII